MKIIVCGAGSVGRSIVAYLSRGSNDIIVIDTDSHKLDEISKEWDIQPINGSASHPDVLEKAGARSADMIIAATDRDEQFDAYTLRHESVSGGKTTFTYLIYYPHGEAGMTPTPEVLEGESGYVVNLTYKAGGSTEGYSLSTLTVTVPTDKAPRLRLIYDGEVLGQMATVSDEEIGA